MSNEHVDLFTLPNGLRVAGERLEHLRSVSVGVWVKVGSIFETPEENGLSHFMEHMAFKGTQRRSARDIAKEMDAVGGQMNAFTGRDCTCYYAKVIDEDLELAFDMLSDLVIHAALDPEEMEKERGVILEEIAIDEDSPEDLVTEMMTAEQFAGQSAGMPILGPAELISTCPREKLKRFRDTHYNPRNTVVSLSGNYDPEKLRALAEAYFGSWQAEGPEIVLPKMAPLTGRYAAREKDVEQLHICLGYPGFATGSSELYPLSVINSVLGASASARLFQRIREELGMAYTVYTYPNSYLGCGSFGVYAGVNPKNGPQALEEMLKVIRDVAENGVTEEEFRSTRTMLRAGILMGLESSGSRMQAMGRKLLLLGSPSNHEETLRAIEQMTRDQVTEVARQVLTAAPSLTVVGRNAEVIRL